MRLNQDLIQRMFDGRGGVAGVGSSLDPGLINGLATEMWTEENYVSKTFFNELFVIHKKTTTTVYDGDTVVSTTTDTSGTFAPNEIPSQEESTDEETGYRTVVVTEVDNIEAKKGLWTDFFLSALGLNGSGGGGGIGDVTWQALGDNTDTRQIASSHLTTALGSALAGYATQSWVTSQNYVTSSAISDMATKTWVNNQSFVNWTALGDTTTTQQIALSHLTTALSGYATQTWVTNNFSTPSSVATQLQTYAKIQNGTITIGDTSITPITSVTGTFWGKSFTNGGTVNGTIKAGSNGGAIEQFHSVEMNSAGTLAGYGGFIDFHYYASGSTFDSTLDYTSRIIESEVGVISILAKNNNATNANKLAGLLVGDGYDGSYVQIGNIRIVYDSTNNALKVVKLVSGSEVAANFYATGSVSALGYGAGGGGGTGDVTWTNLADNTDTRQIALSHLTGALSGYATTSQLAGYLPLSGGTLTSSSPTPLTINSRHSTDSYITFTNNNNYRAWVGYTSTLGVFIQKNTDGTGGPVMGILPSGEPYYSSTGSAGAARSIWHAGNDGTGSGLDADLLDGQHGSYYATAASLSDYVPLTGDSTITGSITTTNNIYASEYLGVKAWTGYGSGQASMWFNGNNGILYINSCNGINLNGAYNVWSERNDGADSGLDADLLDGHHYADMVTDIGVSGDTLTWAKGGVAQTVITVPYASTAAELKTSRSIWGQSFDGSADVSGALSNATSITASGNIESTGGSITTANYFQIRAWSGYGTGFANMWYDNTNDIGQLKIQYAKNIIIGAYTIWHSGNDGANSGLDADLLDGQHGSYYATAASLNDYLPLTGGTLTSSRADPLTIKSTHATDSYLTFKNGSNDRAWVGYTNILGAFLQKTGGPVIGVDTNGTPYYSSTGQTSTMKKLWNEGNDGAGSGLDADLLDGIDSTIFLNRLYENGTYNYGTTTPRFLVLTWNKDSDDRYRLWVSSPDGARDSTVGVDFANDATNAVVAKRSQYLETWNGNMSQTYGNSYKCYIYWETGSAVRFKTEGNYPVRVSQADTLVTSRNIWGKSFNGSADITGTIEAGSSGGAIEGFQSWELNTHNTAGTNVGGFLDFHYNGTAQDYSVRLIEKDYSGVLQILAKDTGTGNAQRAGLIVGAGTYTSFIQIGNGRIVWNDGDHALRIVDKDGNACNLYATGGISALGYQSGGGGGGSTGVFSTNITPETANAYDVGTSGYRWRNLYIGTVYGNTLKANTITITVDSGGSASINAGTAMGMGVIANNLALTASSGVLQLSGSTQITSNRAIDNVSDINLKDIIDYVDASVEKISTIPVFDFKYKSDMNGETYLGTSAQVVRTVFRNAVRSTSEGILTMDYGSAALAAAVLTARKTTEHERRITKLEMENAELRARIKDLEEN